MIDLSRLVRDRERFRARLMLAEVLARPGHGPLALRRSGPGSGRRGPARFSGGGPASQASSGAVGGNAAAAPDAADTPLVGTPTIPVGDE